MAAKLDELEWRSPEWINQFGLRTDNVLEYFSNSPFFDRTSNNQVVKMQRQFSDPNTPFMLEQELKKMKGVEYVVHMMREPDMWIIRKQKRLGEKDNQVDKLADYYVIGSKIYMAPTIFDVAQHQMITCAHSIYEAMHTLDKVVEESETVVAGNTSGAANKNGNGNGESSGAQMASEEEAFSSLLALCK